MPKPSGGGKTTNNAPVLFQQTFLIDDSFGTEVGTVVATDPEGDTLTYSLTDTFDGLFSIDSSTGVISIDRDLDNDGVLDLLNPAGYELSVSVSDGKNNPSTATIQVNVGEVIDLGNLAPADGFQIIGPAGSGIGWEVASAGDVNNDLIADFMITAGNSGQVYVVFGNSNTDGSGNYADVDLTDATTWDGFVMGGGGGGTGDALAAADVNGDGIDDVIVGAPFGGSGRAFVVFGSETPDTEINLDDPASYNGFVIQGNVVSSFIGYALASAGDVNNDQIEDLIVGAPGANGTGRKGGQAGEAYVVYGATDITDINLSDLSSWDGLRILGGSTLEQVGFSVASAGDINGDGIDDVIVGAVGADTDGNTRTAEGAAYVIYGRAGGSGVTDINLAGLAATDGFRILGVDPDDRLGWSVAGVGDANGDGTDDLIVAADAADGDSGGTNVGEVYLIFGRNTAQDADNPNEIGPFDPAFTDIDLATLAAADGIRFVGIDSSDFAGRSVSAAGDVNGDGIGDMLIGTGGGDGSSSADTQAGEAYLIFGKDSTQGEAFDAVIDLGALSPEDGVVIYGADPDDHAGYSVSAVGDINQDGKDDILIGAWGAENGTNTLVGDGRAYILFGRDFSADTMDFV